MLLTDGTIRGFLGVEGGSEMALFLKRVWVGITVVAFVFTMWGLVTTIKNHSWGLVILLSLGTIFVMVANAHAQVVLEEHIPNFPGDEGSGKPKRSVLEVMWKVALIIFALAGTLFFLTHL
jgi:hypothetical protein